jgi:hypothetical protein
MRAPPRLALGHEYGRGGAHARSWLRVRDLRFARRAFQRTVYRPVEVCKFDLWHVSEPVPVGHGQTRQGYVVVAAFEYSRGGRGRAGVQPPSTGRAVAIGEQHARCIVEDYSLSVPGPPSDGPTAHDLVVSHVWRLMPLWGRRLSWRGGFGIVATLKPLGRLVDGACMAEDLIAFGSSAS